MTEIQDQARFALLIHEGTVNDVNLPWLLLCPQENRERRILCLGVTGEDVCMLQSLQKCFTIVSPCSFDDVASPIYEFPSNLIEKHLDENTSLLPYDSGLFDVAVVCNFPPLEKKNSNFFSEIHRVLHPDGCLFFCFPNRLSYQRIRMILALTDHRKEKDVPLAQLRWSVFFCRNALKKSGFDLPHFYTFSPGCNKLSGIRDCNIAPLANDLDKPIAGLKRRCIQFLKKSRFVRNYLSTHYGVVAGKLNGIATIPSLIAKEMTRELQGTSWQVWGDKYDITRKGTFVFKLYDKRTRKAAICKIPLNQATGKHLEANYSALANIYANQELPVEVKERIPFVIVRSEINSYLYFVEELKEGRAAVQYRYNKQAYGDILYESSKLITAIHSSTSVEDETLGKSIIKTKNKLLRRFIESNDNFIIKIEKFLQNSLKNHVLFVANKGDCSANNIIVNSKKEVSGIIDWDQAQKISFPMVDIINLIESFRRHFEKKSMGEVLIECFFEGKRSDLENTILKEYCSTLSLPVDDFFPFAVLYWIDHIIAQDFSSVCQNRKWMQNNVVLVINSLKKFI